MRVLVSGANGFIGRALCSQLALMSCEVIPAVRRPCGILGERILSSERTWSAALEGCSSVVHLAGLTRDFPNRKSDSVKNFLHANVATTEELAHRAVDAGVQRFVFVSTIKVNGETTEPERGCFGPDDMPVPQDPYAVSKWEAEQRLIEIERDTKMEVVIVRPPLVYGPGVKGNFASIIRLLKKEIPLPLGAIHNQRSMIALDNLVSFIALCIDIESSPNARGQIFIISDGEKVSTSDLLRKIAKAYGLRDRLFPAPVGFLYLGMRLMGMASIADRVFGSLVVDDSKAHEMLGWSPSVSMDEQLEKMAFYDSCI